MRRIQDRQKANDTYYLLKRTEVPTIIVECGFLSNPEEAAKLTDTKYQKKMADAITKGIIACVEKLECSIMKIMKTIIEKIDKNQKIQIL